ncbi:MAG: ROK family protein, partial [Acidimicrobiales bacterium]
MGRGQTLAVDLGGTHMRVAVVDPGGRVLDRRQEATPHDARRPVALVDLVRSVLSGPSGEGVAGAVVGTAGSVDYHGGCLDWAPHLPEGWLADLAETRLSAAIGLPVALANDADLAAVGEAYFGAGRGVADVAYVTVSTGIGAGVVLGGRLVHGRLSLAEIGHTVIDRAAFQAGRPATVELLGSGSALDRLAREAGRSGGGAEVDRLAAAGDAWAAAAWDGIVAAVG